jgi:hypothetical protein
MKSKLIIATLVLLTIAAACSKDSSTGFNVTPQTTDGRAGNTGYYKGGTTARLSGTGYSLPIAPDTANKMIASYLISVGYPNADTAVRSLSFDADTLRAYLQDPDITTVKFMVAHQLEYANSGFYGRPAGLKAEAITLVAVAMDDNGRTVLNSSAGVYDHFQKCPTVCPNGISNPYIN